MVLLSPELITLLRQKYQIVFKNYDLLQSALTHASYANEHRELHIQDYEGQLTKLRAAIVCTASFAKFCQEVGLPPFILLGNGEEKAGARKRDTLLEDVFEAFNGALYLDQGNEAVMRFLRQTVFEHIDAGEFSDDNDFKTELQEELQQNGDVDINYRVLRQEGEDETTKFIVQLYINQQPHTTGSGHSKKIAEQQAAQKYLNQLHQK